MEEPAKNGITGIHHGTAKSNRILRLSKTLGVALCRSAILLYRAFQNWLLSTFVKLTQLTLDGNTSRSSMFHCTLFVVHSVFKMLCNELRNLDAYWLILGGLE